MGLDAHGINFIRFVTKKGPLGEVATLGRQGLQKSALQKLGYRNRYGEFCEEFLIENFGASSVESFDNSDFEGATHLLDLNLPSNMGERYDTVIDAGTMEHVYNAPQGFKTVSQMCRTGGRILHMLPANNLCGHGFWQFSPELFFSLYSPKNGYRDTQVFLADVGDESHWYEVTPPKNGRWDSTISDRSLYALAQTTKAGPASHDAVQQSQYLNEWQHGGLQQKTSARDRFKAAVQGTPLFPAFRFVNRMLKGENSDLRKSANLTKRRVATML